MYRNAGRFDPVHAGQREMLRDERVDRLRLLQGAHLHEDRIRGDAPGGEPPGQLVQQERLAGAEVAQDEEEARIRHHQLPLKLVQYAVDVPPILPDGERRALLDVEVRRIDGVGLQPLGQAIEVGPEIDQSLVVGEAHQVDAVVPRLSHQVRGHAFAAIDDVGGCRGISALVTRMDALAEGLQERRGDGLDRTRQDVRRGGPERVANEDLGALVERRRRRAADDLDRALPPLLAHMAHPQDPIEEIVGRRLWGVILHLRPGVLGAGVAPDLSEDVRYPGVVLAPDDPDPRSLQAAAPVGSRTLVRNEGEVSRRIDLGKRPDAAKHLPELLVVHGVADDEDRARVEDRRKGAL